MFPLEFILIFLFHLQGISKGSLFAYSRAGDEVVLSCKKNNSECSDLSWLFANSNNQQAIYVVKNQKVNDNLPKASRLSLDASCSLIIKNVSVEDAGFYACRQSSPDVSTTLSIMAVTALQESDGGVILRCALYKYTSNSCPEGSFKWVDEDDSELVLTDSEHHVTRQTNCISHLLVKRQSAHNRKYTCVYVMPNNVKVKADYTPFPKEDSPFNNLLIIIIVMGLVLVFILIFAVLVKLRKHRTKDSPKTCKTPDEPEEDHYSTINSSYECDAATEQDKTESNQTYITLNHGRYKHTSKKKEEEEAVTYSEVRIAAATDGSYTSRH